MDRLDKIKREQILSPPTPSSQRTLTAIEKSESLGGLIPKDIAVNKFKSDGKEMKYREYYEKQMQDIGLNSKQIHHLMDITPVDKYGKYNALDIINSIDKHNLELKKYGAQKKVRL
jgi:hypothetical protein